MLKFGSHARILGPRKPSQSRKVFEIIVSVKKMTKFGIPARMLFWNPRKGEDLPRAAKCSKSLFL
jgi:hypothetical protein